MSRFSRWYRRTPQARAAVRQYAGRAVQRVARAALRNPDATMTILSSIPGMGTLAGTRGAQLFSQYGSRLARIVPPPAPRARHQPPAAPRRDPEGDFPDVVAGTVHGAEDAVQDEAQTVMEPYYSSSPPWAYRGSYGRARARSRSRYDEYDEDQGAEEADAKEDW